MARLAAALDRLEAAAAHGAGGSDLLAGDELARMRDDYGRLDATTRQVAERLDGALGRLRALLGD